MFAISDENAVMQPSQPESQVADLVRLLWRSKYVLLIGALIGGMLGGGAAWLTHPVYRVTVVMMPSAEIGFSDSLGSALGPAGSLAALVGLGGGGSRVDEAIAVLESRKFTEGLIEERGLLPQLFFKAWDSTAGAWRAGLAKQPSLYDGYRRFEKLRQIRRDNRTGLVTLELIWSDAVEAAELANLMVAGVNDDLRKRDIAEATRSIEQLSAELSRNAVVAVQASINKLIEANVRRRALANARDDYVFHIIDPAVAPDRDDYFRPKPVLFVAAGVFSGLVLGIVAIALSGLVRLLRVPRRASAAE